MTTISAQFVDVAGRRVLVRYAGSGPAVILLHQSPQNSRAMIPWIERLSKHYAVFAPDTPGFGFSDPLALAQPTIPDYAAALNALMDALGIERAMINGIHTGAVTALRFSLDYPERVAALVCDGYARFNTDERQKLLNGYLPPFEPEWNGGHLLWLWSRFREQSLFFPWNVPAKETRIAYPAPTTEKLHDYVLDVLDAGDGYRVGYRAPFLYDDASAASRLTVNGRIFYQQEDVLAPHLSRLQDLPATVSAELIEGGQPVLVAKTDAFFAQHASRASVVDSGKAVDQAVSVSRRIMPTVHGPIGILVALNGGSLKSGPVEVHLHDVGFPARIPVNVPHGTVVIAPELPGHGASRPWSADAVSIDSIAVVLLDSLQALGVEHFALTAEGGACAIGATMAVASAGRCRSLRLVNPLPLDDAEQAQFLSLLPDATPHSTGAHLLAAWNWARMKHLFWPWLPQTGTAVRVIDAPAPFRLHAEALEIIRAGPLIAALWRDALAVSLSETLTTFQGAVTLTIEDEPERVRLVRTLVASLGLIEADAPQTGVRTWLKR